MNFRSIINLSKHKKQVIILYASTLGGVLLGILSSILNTHFLDPKDYGDVRYVQNIVTFVSSLVLLGYFQSGSRLMALSDDKEYNSRVKGMMVIILSIAVLVIALSCLLFSILPTEKAGVPLLFLLAIPVCGGNLFSNYINTTSQGDNQIGRIALNRLLPSLLYIIVAYIVYSRFGASSPKMLMLQMGITTIVSGVIIYSTSPTFSSLGPIWQQLKEENKAYGIQLYIGSLVMVATNYLAGISISAFNADNSEVGFYTLALTVTSPLATLPMIVGTTYFKEFAKQPRFPSKVLKFTLLITVVSCVLFILCIKPCVLFLYSEKYASVGLYASWLALGFSIHGLGDMFNRFLGSHGLGKEIRNASIANGIIKLFGYTVLVYFFNTPGALATTVLCDCIYAGMIYYYYCRFAKTNVRHG